MEVVLLEFSVTFDAVNHNSLLSWFYGMEIGSAISFLSPGLISNDVGGQNVSSASQSYDSSLSLFLFNINMKPLGEGEFSF